MTLGEIWNPNFHIWQRVLNNNIIRRANFVCVLLFIYSVEPESVVFMVKVIHLSRAEDITDGL